MGTVVRSLKPETSGLLLNWRVAEIKRSRNDKGRARGARRGINSVLSLAPDGARITLFGSYQVWPPKFFSETGILCLLVSPIFQSSLRYI